MGDKQHYAFVFAVVTYRNVTDVEEMLLSVQRTLQDSYRVIIVNNFYDDATEQAIRETAQRYDCDFIHSENRGYGSGNNRAVEFALEHYDFDYFIVSNPDTVILSFDVQKVREMKGIIAPKINTLSGKPQNPMIVRDIPFATRHIYRGLKNRNKWEYYTGLAINKGVRIAAICSYGFRKKPCHTIYMAHGSFLIMDAQTLQRLAPVYDENMFLFTEEALVAWRAGKLHIPTHYSRAVQILHKEDGSMKFRNDIDDKLRESNLYFYENYYANPEKNA